MAADAVTAPEPFLGFDHIDVRVHSLALVEPFYDELMPRLGLAQKTFAHVDSAGDWFEPSGARPYNAIEYHEPPRSGVAPRFIGFIEVPDMTPVATRIAFALAAPSAVAAWEAALRTIGARNVERDSDFEDYPALFFEDPAGTRLELCARRPRA